MKRLAVLWLLIPSVTLAQGALIARPVAEDCSLASIGPDDAVTVNWPCVEVYAAKRDWPDATTHSIAVTLKAVRDGTSK